MTHFTEDDVTANGIRIHYYRTGTSQGRPALLLNHGLTDNGLCWVRVANALRSEYDIIMPDTRGHGASDKPETGYSVEERAADVAGLIDALGLNRPIIMGHSMGGEVSNAVAALYPDKVRALVLEDPAWLTPRPPEENQEPHEIGWAAGLRRDQSLTRAELIARCHAENPGWHEDELGPWADSKFQMSVAALITTLQDMRFGWPEFVRQVKCPALVVTAEPGHGIISPAQFQQVAASNPLFVEAHIPNAGHNIHRDQFEPYMQEVRAFLSKV